MELVNLCVKDENKSIDNLLNKERQEMDEYINFVYSLTDRQDIKDRILMMKEDLMCYVIDSIYTTKIP